MLGKAIKIGRKDLSEIVFDIVKYVVLTLFTFACIYPFYYVIIYSFSNPELAKRGVWLWPKGFTVDTYVQLFKKNELLPAFGVSTARTVLGTLITVFCSALAAFLATRKDFPWRRFFYRFIITSMYVSSGLIPWFLIMRLYGFQNTFLLYIVPSAVSAYYMLLIKTFIEQLPESLVESAVMEGAGFFTVFTKIIIPLSKPILATVAVYCAVSQWNSWSDNFFLNQEKSLTTLSLILQSYIKNAKALERAIAEGIATGEEVKVSSEAIQMATVVVTMLPIMLVYPFAQRYFTKGIMMGAIKG